jgi:hypothetical protein
VLKVCRIIILIGNSFVTHCPQIRSYSKSKGKAVRSRSATGHLKGTRRGRVVLVPRIVTMVAWLAAPEWLTLAEASFLSGHDDAMLRWMIDDGAVDTNDEGLIAKDSLRDYQETLLEVSQGKWG